MCRVLGQNGAEGLLLRPPPVAMASHAALLVLRRLCGPSDGQSQHHAHRPEQQARRRSSRSATGLRSTEREENENESESERTGENLY